MKFQNKVQRRFLLIVLFALAVILVSASPALSDELPACGDYQEPELWWDVENYFETISDFVDLFGTSATAICTATVIDNEITIDCENWSMTIIWNRDLQSLPITDGQSVRAHVPYTTVEEKSPSDEYFGGPFYLFDMTYNALLGMGYGTTSFAMDAGAFFQDGDSDSVRVCYYDNAYEQPPLQAGDLWAEVYGMNLTGYFGESQFDIEMPGEWTETDDGLYQIFLPVAWEGETDEDAFVYSLFQIMRSNGTTDDDDDTADDSADDVADDSVDDAADDTQDASDDAAGDDDDDDGGGCFG